MRVDSEGFSIREIENLVIWKQDFGFTEIAKSIVKISIEEHSLLGNWE